jgi:hypothetical protein
MTYVHICSATKQGIKSEVCRSDLRCAKGDGVLFLDLKVCKRSLGDFLGVFLIHMVCYEGLKVCDVSMCIVLRL